MKLRTGGCQKSMKLKESELDAFNKEIAIYLLELNVPSLPKTIPVCLRGLNIIFSQSGFSLLVCLRS